MSLKNHSLTPNKPAEKADPLANLDDAGLLELRNRIDARLTTDISQLNLTEELGLQFRAGKLLLAKVQEDAETPANQKAQVFNSVSAMLTKIIEQQELVFNAERLKRYEAAMLKVLELCGTAEQRAIFFDLYGEFLGAKSA